MKTISFVLASAVFLLGVNATAAQDIEEGAALFQNHCASCHGLDADGKGPMAAVLTVQPKDLTQLSTEGDGVFPTVRVVMRIDGRDPLVSHGSLMPVYGDFFEGYDTPLKAANGQPILTSRAIVDLVSYLEGLQK
jgi:hypothetical protein